MLQQNTELIFIKAANWNTICETSSSSWNKASKINRRQFPDIWTIVQKNFKRKQNREKNTVNWILFVKIKQQ